MRKPVDRILPPGENRGRRLKEDGFEMKRELVVLTTLAFSGCCPGPFCPNPTPTNTIADAVRALGYVPLQNPNNNYVRGAIIAVTSKDPLNGDIVCPANQVVGGVTLLGVVGGIATAWQTSTQNSFAVDASVVKNINAKLEAKLGAQAVNSVSASLSNTSVGDLAGSNVVEAAMKQTNAFCITAINLQQQLSPRQPVVMISSNLSADASYKINWNDSVSAQAQAQFTPQISGDIAANLQSTGSGTLTGNGLVYGVHDKTQFLQEYVMSLPSGTVGSQTKQKAAAAVAAIANRFGASVLKSP